MNFDVIAADFPILNKMLREANRSSHHNLLGWWASGDLNFYSLRITISVGLARTLQDELWGNE